MYYANTLKTAAAGALFGLAAIAATGPNAQAQPQFDPKLAKFMADKAADALGDLRLETVEGAVETAAAEETSVRTPETDVIETGSVLTYGQDVDTMTTTAIAPTGWLLPRTDIRIVYAG